VLLILFNRVPENRAEGAAGPLDWWGALLTLGLGAVVYGLIEAGSRGLADSLALGALIVGSLALAAFVVVEARSPAPMVPLSLFRSSTFSGANLLTFLLYAALGDVLRAIRSDPGLGLLADSRWCRLLAVDRAGVHVLALVRRSGPLLRRDASAGV
jgi:hypothetical protein